MLKREVIALGTSIARFLLQCGRIAFAGLLLLLAGRVEAGNITTDDAVAVAALAAVALLLLSLTPRVVRTLSQRVSKISVGPFALEIVKAAERVTATAAEDTDEREPVASVLDLQLKIERKLTYLAKHVLDENGHPTFLTVGSLKWDELLPAEEADLVNRLMTFRDEDLRELTPAEQDEFLKAADKIARSIRASVLHCLVWKRLERLKKEDSKWRFEKAMQPKGKRPDIEARREGRRYLITPVFATSKKSEILDRTKERLQEPIAEGEDCAGSIVVLPHQTRSPKDPAGSPAVVTTDDLVDALKDRERAAEG